MLRSPHPGGRGPPVGNNYPPVREGTVGPFRPRIGSRDRARDQEAGGMAAVPAFRISKKMGQSGPCHWGRSRQGARFGGSRGGASGVPLGVVRGPARGAVLSFLPSGSDPKWAVPLGEIAARSGVLLAFSLSLPGGGRTVGRDFTSGVPLGCLWGASGGGAVVPSCRF